MTAALGSPAFAISRLRFVCVEGDRQSRERERFYAVCGDPDVNRFLEGGSCNEVLRRLRDVRALAAETDEQLHVSGVIDGDFRVDDERLQLQGEAGVHVLGCHEVDNLYLQPEALAVLLRRAGRDPDRATGVVRDSADYFAGLWVAQYASAGFAGEVPKEAMSALGGETLAQLSAAWSGRRNASGAAIDVALRQQWEELLEAG